MKNLYFLFGIMIVAEVCLLMIGIILTIRKSRNYILADIIIIILVSACIIVDIPTIKDVINKETTEIVAEYEGYVLAGHTPGAIIIKFKNAGKSYEISSPRLMKIHVDLEVGKTYKVTFFNNTKIIKEYELIE